MSSTYLEKVFGNISEIKEEIKVVQNLTKFERAGEFKSTLSLDDIINSRENRPSLQLADKEGNTYNTYLLIRGNCLNLKTESIMIKKVLPNNVIYSVILSFYALSKEFKDNDIYNISAQIFYRDNTIHVNNIYKIYHTSKDIEKASVKLIKRDLFYLVAVSQVMLETAKCLNMSINLSSLSNTNNEKITNVFKFVLKVLSESEQYKNIKINFAE